MLLELTLRNSKRSNDLAQPYQCATSLIIHILDHIKEEQRANFGSTHTIFECSNTIFQGPTLTHGVLLLLLKSQTLE